MSTVQLYNFNFEAYRPYLLGAASMGVSSAMTQGRPDFLGASLVMLVDRYGSFVINNLQKNKERCETVIAAGSGLASVCLQEYCTPSWIKQLPFVQSLISIALFTGVSTLVKQAKPVVFLERTAQLTKAGLMFASLFIKMNLIKNRTAQIAADCLGFGVMAFFAVQDVVIPFGKYLATVLDPGKTLKIYQTKTGKTVVIKKDTTPATNSLASLASRISLF